MAEGLSMQVEEAQMYRVREVADALAVSVTTIYRAIEAGQLAALKLGTESGTWRVRGSAVLEYLRACEQAVRPATSAPGACSCGAREAATAEPAVADHGFGRGVMTQRRWCGVSSGLVRQTSLRRTRLRSVPVVVPAEVRRALEIRSGGVCEVTGLAETLSCAGQASDVHHRVRRGMGGRHGAARSVSDRLSNLLHVCRLCHEVIHAGPAASREAGWLLLGSQQPPLVALLYRSEPCYLTDDGRVTAFEAVGA